MPRHKREWYIPKGSQKVTCKNSGAVVYWRPYQGKREGITHEAVAFHGRAQKPDWHYVYKSAESLHKAIVAHFKNCTSWQKNRKEWRDKANTVSTLKVGDILYSSWGYDQTNVDWFKVVSTIGKRTVELIAIGANIDSRGHGAENATPDPDSTRGDILRKRVHNGSSVTIDNVRTAWLWDGKPKHQTAYGWGH